MSINEEFQTVFHGVSYILSISLKKNSSVLYIDVEQENTGDRWRGEFSAKYIEQITQKTGNFKRFVVFAKMLTVALGQKSETVFVDLLTYNDLEMLNAADFSCLIKNRSNNELEKKINCSNLYISKNFAPYAWEEYIENYLVKI